MIGSPLLTREGILILSARLNGETILIHEQAEAVMRAASQERRLTAPCCGAPMVVRWGMRRARHFAHLPGAHCPYDRWSEPESVEHAAGKLLLYDWCRRHFGGRIRHLALEHPLPETLQRPDVYLELADGSRYALEYQRSPITPGEWTERHDGYVRQGIHDVWLLGENRLADALPSAEQQARWAAKEPHMHFLKLRAFESESAVKTPFEVAWWRGDHQEELWAPQELDARVGREVSPWYRRSALARLRSVTFLDANTEQVTIYRAMRELPAHLDTKMASVVLRVPLDAVSLTPTGFVTAADAERLGKHQERVARLESALGAVREAPAAYTTDVDRRRYDPAAQAAEQQRRLAVRAEQPDWRMIVDRYGLKPENLHFLVGVAIPDDTVILVHRTVWQAFIYYRFVMNQRGSLTARGVARLLERKFGFDPEMVRTAHYLLPGQVPTPVEVVGRFLNLLVDMGCLRNERRSEHFHYHGPSEPVPPLAFADRKQRQAAWAGLLSGALRREGLALVGEGGPIALVEAPVEDAWASRRWRGRE